MCFVFVVLILGTLAHSVAQGAYHRRLGVYSLRYYGQYAPPGASPTKAWKTAVPPGPSGDPGLDFWSKMTCSGPAPCANASMSRRFFDSQVVPANVVGNQEFVRDNWTEFDLVFFYGHNNFIVPPHPHDGFDYWTYNGYAWQEQWTSDLGAMGWGTTSAPYEYHRLNITNADQYPAAVVYLHNPFTSVLVGNPDFTGSNYYKNTWNGPDTYYESRLGGELKWLVLHGCQAVIVANESGSSYDDRGVRAFGNAWSDMHVVMGHYRSFYLSDLPDLNPFANDLKAGMPVKQAYFARDTVDNSSAISGENESSRSCGWVELWGWWFWLCYIDDSKTYMGNDRWTAPMNSFTPTWFHVKWVNNIT